MHAIGYSRSKHVTAKHDSPKTGHVFYRRGKSGWRCSQIFLYFSALVILPPILYYLVLGCNVVCSHK